jgi:hypothetical protein
VLGLEDDQHNEFVGPAAVMLGGDEHKERFCQLFLETHVAFDIGSVEWPELDEAQHHLLAGLPIWDEAVNTEHETAVLVRRMADAELDPVLAEAIALQALEEERHASLINELTAHYGFPVRRRGPRHSGDPRRDFLKSGWGECIDSFFAFGIFAVAEELQMVPKELLAIFDRVMQEEARHILFFENWRVFLRRADTMTAAATFSVKSAAAVSAVVAERLRLAVSGARSADGSDQNFVFSGAQALGSLTPRSFVDTCLTENQRRFAPYDPMLPRPRVVPQIARAARRLLPDRPLGPSTATGPTLG